MRMIFAHDHKFIKVGEAFYSPGKFGHEAFKRYLRHFDEIVIIARYDDLQAVPEKYVRADGEGVSIQPLPNFGSIKGQLSRFRGNSKLEELLDSADGAVVRLPSEIGLILAQMCRSRRLPYAVEVVGCAFDALWNHRRQLGKLYAPFAHLRMRYAVKKANAALYVTNRFLQTRYPSDAISVEASNVNISMPGTNHYIARESTFRKSSSFVLGLIGSLDAGYKGHDTAIHAVKKIRGHGIDISIRFLGDGYGNDIRSLVNKLCLDESVFFDGVLPPNDLICWLDEIDIYVHPSRAEGLPRAVIEAMSRGIPVIGSTAGAMSDLVRPDLLHKPRDVKSLVHHTLRLLGNEQERKLASDWSFKKAENYRSEVIEAKRDWFWSQFRSACSEQLYKS